jgi:putative hydrolase of the HAD superfamily
MKLKIDTVTFDLWNTLLLHNEDYDRDIRRIRSEDILDALKGIGLDVTAADVENGYVLSDGRLLERWSGDLDMSLEEQLDVFLECMGIRPTPERIEAIRVPYSDAVMKLRPTEVDGALDAVKKIKGMGYKVALISNTGRTPGRAMRKVLDDYGFTGLFEVTTFSDEEGFKKPHPEIFRRTLLQLNASPGSTVHVGDHGLLDVLGARNAGMRCVRVTRYAHEDDGQYTPDVSIECIEGLAEAVNSLER